MDTAEQLAPPVVAVMVVHEPDLWFDEVLTSLEQQDYPNLRVLVLVTGEPGDVPEQVRSRVPRALVRSVAGNPGFAAAANEALRLVEGDNGFFCFLHDDVALASDAVRVLVEELFRSNAGIVGPKLVAWHTPTVLSHVGLAVDQFGEIDPIVEPGETDQEQHDGVADVFAVSSACLLVRADLFRTLGGFDSRIEYHGEAVELCWRAHHSGARVLVVPSAKGRHLGGLEQRQPDLRHTTMSEANRMRTVATLTGARRLPWVLVKLTVLTLAEFVIGVVSGHAAQGWAAVRGLFGLIPQVPAIVAQRRELAPTRRVPDSEVAGLQLSGSARLRTYLRARDARPDHRDHTQPWRERAGLGAAAVWAGLVVAVLLGSRHIISDGSAHVGQFLPYDSSPLHLLRTFASGWNARELGVSSANPTGLALVGIASVATLFHMGALHTLGIIGALVVGPMGVWRVTRGFSSRRARLATLLVYAALPLASQAISVGRWSVLAVSAALPWSLEAMRRVAGLAATVSDDDGERVVATTTRQRVQIIAGAGVVAAIAGSFEPSYLLMLIVVGCLVGLATLISGAPVRAALWMAGTALCAAAIGFVLELPWSAAMYIHGGWAAIVGPSRAALPGQSAFSTLSFHIGRGLGAPLALALYLPALGAVLLGRGWRFGWALRAAVLVVGFGWLAVWSAQSSSVRLPEPGVLLVPVALGLALAAGCIVAAFETDVRVAGFGWRQPLCVLCALAALLGAVPGVLALRSGRWDTPRYTLVDLLGQLPQHPAEGDYRVLWLGDQRLVPVLPHALANGVGYGLSRDRTLLVDDTWSSPASAGDGEVVDALEAIATGSTTRAGRLLAPFAVRYVVVPVIDGSISTGDRPVPLPAGLLDALRDQLDLAEMYSPPSFIVFENRAWVPMRSVLTADGAEASTKAGATALAQADLSGATPVMVGADQLSVATVGAPQGTVHLAVPFDDHWRLSLDGKGVAGRPAFGSTTAFDLAHPGTATLEYAQPLLRRFELLLVALGWVLALGVAMGVRLRRPLERTARVASESAEPVIVFDPITEVSEAAE